MSLIPHLRPPAFYRSTMGPVGLTASGLFMFYALSPAGPAVWRETPSLLWLHRVLPWPVMAVGFLLYVVLLILGSFVWTRGYALGCWLGLYLYACGFAASVATLRLDHKTNPYLIAGTFLAGLLHYLSGRLAEIQGASDTARGD